MSATPPKPGFATSEFWAVVLTAVVAVLPTFLSAYSEAHAQGTGVVASLGVALAAAVYAYGRSKVKAQHEMVKRQEIRELGRQSDEDVAAALESA